MSTDTLLDHFSALDDPHQACKVTYPLPEMLLIELCATMAGAEDFVETERWANRKLGFLRRFLAFANGIPSHDTLNYVINALPAESFQACFVAWVDGLRDDDPEIVANAGKTSRRSHNRAKGQNPLHLVSTWASRQRLVLGQQACDEKSNEITAIPALLERLKLTGALVTIDAMVCQSKIGTTIRNKGADYLLALKENWPALAAEVERFFAETALPPASAIRPSMASMVASRHAAMPSAVRSTGSHPTGAFPERGASRIWPWLRPRSRKPARPACSGATISPPPSISLPPCAPTGTSRTGCTGSWTLSSTTI